ncbi:glutathione peroxidase [Saccharibacillus sp. CPCC 101409]|uniref:glutathione peroxidase n=1 Tax=Saccharibacillus sp. CPCC 101409 TaxID=3058041 RepID=UPI002673C5A2|nr:glutathione peroxidase [Saccharibacillus sp. CPCC 101409]MDO3408626.1 glutathione peroxidase [Saccharibacillus sp. CPCC 101409]
MSVYEYQARTSKGEEIDLSAYRGKTLLIVNTASKCGFTPQFEGLQKLYDKYHDRGLEILGFPSNQFAEQDPGSNDEILEFCQLNYGVNFPMFEKTDVKGEKAHPLFRYLSEEAPGLMGSKSVKWNFTKFLIDKEGRPVKRFAPQTSPDQLEKDIEKLLGE